MIEHGVILAGGKGTRLSPITDSVSKHFLPLYDKPVIFYSLSVLMLMKIKNILIICNAKDLINYKKLLGNGSNYGINLNYKIQKKANGIPEAIPLSKNFVKNKNFVLILGDNFLYGNLLSKILQEKAYDFQKGCQIFTYEVSRPELYGILIKNKNKLSFIEKPKNSKSNKAVIGLYFFDGSSLKRYKYLNPSIRNETEIIDLIKSYNKTKEISHHHFERGFTWFDTGSYDELLEASNFVQIVEKRQNTKIACLEEISLNNSWLKLSILKKILKDKNSLYFHYLKKFI
jgi:glucose-1-phosphate thymidylyltransferase